MALRLELKVVPASGKTGCIIDKQQRLKCFLKSAPENGKANYELIKFFAKLCNVTQRDVEIIAGFTDKNKVLLIKTDLCEEQILERLGIAKQSSIF
ncbi:MAG: DUF167 domain-containing protein [Candidatus Chromulinivorax sp.]